MKKARVKWISLALATCVLSTMLMTDLAAALQTVESDQQVSEDYSESVVDEAPSEPEETTLPVETEPSETDEADPTETVPSETSESSESSATKPVEETDGETTVTEPSEIAEPTSTVTPTQAPTTTPTVTPTATPTATPTPEPVAFEQSVEVEGVEVKVVADAGVFPEGSVLQVKYINDKDLDDISEVHREANVNVAESLVFDISIVDKDGNEIQPDTTKGEVKVQFYDNRFADKNLDATVYHVKDDKAVNLDYEYIDNNGDVTENADKAVAVEAGTDGFSYYTVEFTYNEMQYVLDGTESVSLNDILKAVGLEGTVTSVEVSNSSLINISDSNVVSANKAFNSTEWMKVTINDVVYEIIVTDEAETTGTATAGEDAYAVLYSDGTFIFQRTEIALEGHGDVSKSWLIPVNYDDPATTEHEKLPWYNDVTSVKKVIFNNQISGVTNASGYFSGMTALATIENIDRFDTSEVTNMGGMFSGCSALTGTLDLSSWNTSKVTNLGGIFNGCSSLTKIDMHGLDLSKAGNGGGSMFSSCASLTYLDISGVKVGGYDSTSPLQLGWSGSLSNATLQTINVSNMDISSVTTLRQFFAGCPVREIIGLETWNTSHITDMYEMFFYCSNLTSVDLSTFDFSNVENVHQLLGYTNSLTSFTLPTSFSNVAISESNNVWVSGSWKNAAGSNFLAVGIRSAGTYTKDTTAATVGDNAYAVLYSDGTLVFQNSADADPSYGTAVNSWALTATNYPWRDNNKADIKKVVFESVIYGRTNTSYMFADCPNITAVVGADKLDMSAVTRCYAMFYGCSSMTSMDAKEWNLNKVTDFEFMFDGCSSLTDLDMSNWDASAGTGTKFEQILNGCSSLTFFDFTKFNCSSAESYSHMFSSMTALRGFKINGTVKGGTGVMAGTTPTDEWCKLNSRSPYTTYLSSIFGSNSSSAGEYLQQADLVYTTLYSAGGKFPTITSAANSNLSFKISPCGYAYEDYLSSYQTFDELPVPVRGNDVFLGWYDADGNKIEHWSDIKQTIVDRGTYSEVLETPLEARWQYTSTEHTPVTMTAGVDANVIIYTDLTGKRTAIIQKGKTIDPADMEQYGPQYSIYTSALQPTASFPYVSYGEVIIKDYLVGMTTLSFDYGTGYAESELDSHLVRLTNLDHIDTSTVTHLGRTTYDYTGKINTWSPLFGPGVLNIDGCENWNLSNVTSMEAAFSNCLAKARYDSAPMANWDLSHVTDMDYMFYKSNGATLPVMADWDVSHVTTMSHMLDHASGDYSIIKDWNTSGVKDMSYLCNEAEFFQVSDLSGWNTSSVENFSHAFYKMPYLASVKGIQNWNTSSATDMSYMFAENSDLAGIPTLNWNTEKVENMAYMFASNPLLTNINGISSFKTQNVKNMEGMFYNDTSLSDISVVSTWNTGNVETMKCMFTKNLFESSETFSGWDTKSVTDMSYMFQGCGYLSDTTGFANWDVSKVTTMAYMFDMDNRPSGFSGAARLQTFEGLTDWTTTSLTDMSCMFRRCGITDLTPLANWDVSKVTTLEHTFVSYNAEGAKACLTTLEPLSGWQTTSLTNLLGTFDYQQQLVNLNGLEGWDVSHVTDMYETFGYNNRLKDMSAIKNWNTSSCTRFSYLFNNDTALEIVDFGNWDFSSINLDKYGSVTILNGCSGLVEITLPESYPSKPYSTYFPSSISSGWVRKSDGQTYNMQSEVMNVFTSELADTYYHSYRLTLYPMGGTISPREFYISTQSDTEITLGTPERTGYTFEYWFDANGNQYGETITIPAGTVIRSLYAKWSAGSYTLVLQPNRTGLSPVTKTLSVEEIFKLDGNIFGEVEGYNISYWSTRSSGDGDKYDVNSEVMALGENGTTVTLYANWVASSNTEGEEITLNIHNINVITGEETGTDTIKAIVGQSSSAFDHQPAVENGQIVYRSFANDLDAVHYDGTGKAHEEDTVYSSSNSSGETKWSFNYLTEERAQFVDPNYIWTTEDDGRDIYLYYYSYIPVKVNLAPQVTEHFPDKVIMSVDGVEYPDGYILWVAPKNFNSYVSDSWSAYREYDAKTPDYWVKCGVYDYTICWDIYDAQRNLVNNHKITFNYPFLRLNTDSTWWASPNIYKMEMVDGTDSYTREPYQYESWSKDYSTQYGSVAEGTRIDGFMTLAEAMDHTFEVYALLNAEVEFYYQMNDTTPDYVTTYYIGGGYTPDLTRVVNGLYPNTVVQAPEGYVFNGYWSLPEGGTCLMPVQSNGYVNIGSGHKTMTEADIIASNGKFYAQFRPATPDDHLSNGYPMSEEYMITAHDDENKATVKCYSQSSGGYSWKYFFESMYSDLVTDRVPYYHDNMLFVGWYTEPNGQGDCISSGPHSYDPITGDTDIYAYWTSQGYTVSFDLYTSSVHPLSAMNPIMLKDTLEHFTSGPDSTYLCAPGCKFTKYMVPVTETDELYNFKGWYTEPDGKGTKLEEGYQVEGDVTFYAYWEACAKTAAGAALDVDWIIAWTNTDSPVAYGYNAPLRVRFKLQTGSGQTIPKDAVIIAGAGTMGTSRYPTVATGNVFSYTYGSDYGIEDSYYVVANPVAITGGSGIDYTSTVYSNDFRTVKIIVDLDPDDGTVDLVIEKDMTLIQTEGTGSSVYKDLALKGDAYTSWPNISGVAKPADADDYIYVHWYINAKSSNSGTGGPFDFMGIDLIDGIPGAEIVCGEHGWKDVPYNDKIYGASGWGVWVRYPNSIMDYETGRAIVDQAINLTQYPTYDNIEPRTIRLDGEVIIRWNRNATNHGDYEFMIGRGKVPYSTTNRVVLEQKSLVRNKMLESSGMQWYVHEASRLSEGQTHVVGMTQGDLYYNTGASDDYYMVEPVTGNYILTDDDYRISKLDFRVDMWWAEFDDSTATYNYDSYVKEDVSMDGNVAIWIRRANKSEYELYETYDSSWYSMDRTIYFSGEYDDVVEVQVRVTGQRPSYIRVDCCPVINVKNNLRMHNYFTIDNSQLTSSVFKMDGRVGNVDTNGNVIWSHSFFSGWSGPNYTVTFDGNCTLDIYEIAPDLIGDRYFDVRMCTPNTTTAGTTAYGEIYLWNRSTEQHDWVPIDSGEVYVWAPDDAHLKIDPYMYYGKTDSATRSSIISSYTGTGYSPYGTSTVYLDSIFTNVNPHKQFTVEYLENYKGTGMTLAIIRFNGLSEFYDEDHPWNMLIFDYTVMKDEMDVRYGSGALADICAIGVNRSDTGRMTNQQNPETYLNGNTTYGIGRQIVEDYIVPNPSNMIGCDLTAAEWTISTNTQFGFNQYAANSSGRYKEEISVFPGEEFTELIVYGVDGNIAVDGIKIDVKLDGVGTWVKGTIPEVAANGHKSTPDVWYCMTPDPDFEHIDAEHGWSQEDPTGKIVYGVHADYSKNENGDPFRVSENASIIIMIKEKNGNPTGIDSRKIESTLYTHEIQNGDTITTVLADNTLKFEDPEIELTLDSKPASGTVDNPTYVPYEGDLIYEINVTNKSDRAIKDVVITDTLPGHMHYDIDQITINGQPIVGSGVAKDVTFENNVLTFTLSTISNGATTKIVVNSYVNERTTADINNQAHLISYFDTELRDDQKIDSNITYHYTEWSSFPDPTGFTQKDRNILYIVEILLCGTLLTYEVVDLKKKRRKKEAEE